MSFVIEQKVDNCYNCKIGPTGTYILDIVDQPIHFDLYVYSDDNEKPLWDKNQDP